MIYTVTVNPCLDVLRFLAIDSPSLSDGTYRLDDPNIHEKVRPGGKGIDVSRALVCLRCETKALGFIGDQTGDIVKGLLAAEGIDHDFINSGIETRTNLILVLQNHQRKKVLGEIRVNSQGREIPPNKFQFLYDQASRVDDAQAVAISGSLSFNMQPTFYNFLITTFKKKNPHCIVVLDGPAPATAEAMFLPQHRPDFIKPNLKEFNELLINLSGRNKYLWLENEHLPDGVGDEQYFEYCFTGIPLDLNLVKKLPDEKKIDEEKFIHNWETLLRNVLYIWEKFKVSTLLSLGPAGCIACDIDNTILHAYIPESVEAKTRVGAGDCLVAGFTSQYVCQHSGSIQAALKAGVAAATARIVVEEYGANKYLDINEYKLYLSKTRLDLYRPTDSFSPKFTSYMPPELCRFSKGTKASG
jgi:fructose-1-phosphate kinase PfkB-like protein